VLGFAGHHESKEAGRVLGVVELQIVGQLPVTLFGFLFDENREVESVLDGEIRKVDVSTHVPVSSLE
jgi:hypothetical protein